MEILWFLIIGAVAGFLAGKLTSGEGFGVVGNLIIGIIGAIVGGFAFALIGLSADNLIGRLITAVVGAVIFLFVLGKVVQKK